MLQPTGHTSDGSGLQNHSIGGIFPRVAVYYPFTRTWRIMEANGTYSKEFSSYDAACSHANGLQQREAYFAKLGAAADAACAAALRLKVQL